MHALLLAALLAPQVELTDRLDLTPRTDLDHIPVLPSERVTPPACDWLVEPTPLRAGVFREPAYPFLILDNGLLRRLILVGDSIATAGLEELGRGRTLLRAVSPEATLRVDGEDLRVGGMPGQPNRAFVDTGWLSRATPDAQHFEFIRARTGPIEERLEWKRVRHHAPDVAWPPPGVALHLDLAGRGTAEGLEVTIHYALYDGIPAYSKWLTLTNRREEPIVLESFRSEILAAVERSSWVETREVALEHPDLHVETDYSFGGMTHKNANAHVVRWSLDPEYSSQVNYEKRQPCLLEVGPELGPAASIPSGGTFESFRTFVLSAGDESRERAGLARRRMMRTVAPWVTENPLMMHVRWSDPDTVRAAIDQCAEVGFEMVILTFGSGFNAENTDPAYLAEMKGLADYAHERGIELGGYSLLSSRRIQPDSDNCIHPERGEPGADIHGNCPSLTSGWGQRYFKTLTHLYETTGFDLLEHDGSWPGTPDDAARPPLQTGLKNSRWAQWSVIRDFYRWCRGRGVYLNVPDHYYLTGSNKCAMGYREVNWSLPRRDQVIHTRQNIFDGTWTKTPSMGWMFVPLTEYHGGGAAATIEPLNEHLDHYRAMLLSNLAMGVQACYRGPRLYDTDETRDAVAEAVAWFKQHRRILEADLVHGRRADGRHVDWMLHVDPLAPAGEAKGMLVAFNPSTEERTVPLDVDLTLTGLVDSAHVTGPDGPLVDATIDRRGRWRTEVTIPAGGMTWRRLH